MPSQLEDLQTRQSDLLTQIRNLAEERDRLYNEFQARVNGDSRPSDEEITRFEARRNHVDEAVRPSDDEVRAFEARMNAGPSDDEVRAFNAAHAERRNAIRDLYKQLEEVDENLEEKMREAKSERIAQEASKGVEFSEISRQREPSTYRLDNQNQYSYFLDLAAMQNMEVRSTPDPRLEGFRERLDRHAKEMADVLPVRWAQRKAAAERRVEDAESATRSRLGFRDERFEVSPFERQAHLRSLAPEGGDTTEFRAPSRIVGQGGYAIPPLWLIDEYIPALRPGRVAAGLCRQMPLPEGTDSINIPRLLTPTLTGIQSADAAPVVSRDFSDTFQQANVKTVAGQEDVPIQLIEQSPGQILDRVLMTDLIADYNKQVDLQVLTGSGVGAPLSGGQVVGIYPATNWGATTASIGSLGGSVGFGGGTLGVTPQAEFFQFLGAMASKTSYSRFNLTDFNFLMHPRRHFWAATGLDGLGRPLASDDGFGPTNSQQIEIDPAPYEGYAGRLPYGPRVYIDANVPITDNGSGASGGSNDVVVGAIWDDLWLFEGDLRTRVLTEVLSGTLELRFQVYAYIAFLARYGVSIALGYGSPFSQPYSFNGSANGVAF
jgi:hypothetical protein